ncbi:MAG: glycosyltransferase family 4 protein [Acutalibacteraceae bacterium]
MKKILFAATITDHFYYFHLPYIKYFHDSGWEVHVAGKGSRALPFCDVQHDIPIERSPFSTANIKAYKQLKKVIDDGGFDIIHCHTPMGGMLTRIAALSQRRKGTSVLYTAHGFHFYKGAPIMNWLIYYPIEKAMSHMTDCLITINDEDYAFAKKHLKAARVELVNGVGYNSDLFFKLDDEKRLALRRKNGYSPDEKLLIYVAEMNKNKNQSMLLDMMKELKDSHNVRLLIAGADNFDGRYISYAKQLGVDGKVDFLGHREDVCELVGMSDICVASSLREGLPVNIMEAMACGLPVVAADNRGHRALIKDGRDGFLVPANDSHKMAQKVSALLDNEELFSQISSNAADDVKKFSKENVGRQMISIYKDYQR